MIKPFDAARIKIDRAKRHLQELRTEIAEFFGRGGARVVFELADEYTQAVSIQTGAFVYRESEPIPPQWAAIIGDALHNLRSSFDLMASDIHRMTNGNPKDTPYVHYPFCKDKSELPGMIKSRRLNRIGREFLEIIEQTAPYKGGNDGLCAIHDLNILDKHQALVPTVAVVTMDWPVKITNGPQHFATGIMKNGQRLMIFPRAFCQLQLGSSIKAEFSIVFGDVGTFRHSDVVRQLEACIFSVEAILGLFLSVAEKKALGSVGCP